MLIRAITVVVSVAVLIPILIYSGTLVLPVAVAIFTLIALYEIFRCIGVIKNLWLTVPFYLCGAAAPFGVRYINTGMHFTTAALLAMIFLVLWIMALIVFSNNKISYSAAGEAFFSSLYIVFAFTGIVWLRDLDNGYIYLLIFIGAWVTDTFAYLTGVTIGRHKLIPVISPKKTVEGSIGGTLFATAAFAVTSYFIGIWSVGLIVIITGGLLVSVIAQIGDLCMSAIKRQHGIKDFGNLFPGHGGVLDRFDSILAVSSVMTLLFAAINIFTK
jgi:phosphatidate cytidylyltransferase